MSSIAISPPPVVPSIAGATGSVDNAVLRADGTGGTTLQSSGLIIEDVVNSFDVTGDAGTDVITATGSAFTNGQPVRFSALTGGSGLNTTTNYYVREVAGATFKVETSIGGGAVNFTTNITAGTIVVGHIAQALVQVTQNTPAPNSSLVLTPKGTGAFIVGPLPDGSSLGRVARGEYAVDLQMDGGGLATGAAATGQYSFLAGRASRARGLYAAAIGYNSDASGQSSVVLGESSAASGANSASIGRSALADRNGMHAHANGMFAAMGDSQRAKFVMRSKTTTNAAVELLLDGSANRLTVPSGKIMSGTINITGTKSDGTAVAHYMRQFSIKNVAGTTSEVYAPVTIGADNAAGTSISVTASDTNDSLKIEVTGVLNETWRWVASVDAVEVAYGT